MLKITILSLFLTTSILCRAEVVLDGSLGTRGALTGPNFAIPSELGQSMGNNLFHSFHTFNLQQGESATFSGPNTVGNIISRVTGNSASWIDGQLRSTIPNANMYFLNPHGILFGEHASLDVQGSLYLSTANVLQLGSEGRFHTNLSEHSVLSVAPPSAFGFLTETPASIQVGGSFLQVPVGKTLSVLGGNLQITDGTLSAPGGSLNLVAIASPGTLSHDSLETQAFQQQFPLRIKK